MLVSSSKDKDMVLLSIFLRLIPNLWNSDKTASADENPDSCTLIATVSKYPLGLVANSIPSGVNSSMKICEKKRTLVAIFVKPLGPCHCMKKEAMLASKACAVQMLLVALSLLICYSLVCKAILKAWFPWRSLEIPIILPGIFLLYLSTAAKYPG